MSKPTSHDAFVNSSLRGLAILGVLTIHTLSSIHGDYLPSSGWSWVAIGLDQLARFSVPLFVALSGYGFWQKYAGQPFNYLEFITRQAKKLLPWYVVASVTYSLIFLALPGWKALGDVGPIWRQLVRGTADYQLYFVPMIFELYLLFPVVKKLVEKLPWISLGAGFLGELWLYQHATIMGGDQDQYRWFFTWIFYYILGMLLPRIHAFLRGSTRKILAVYALAAGSCFYLIWRAATAVAAGVDPIIAMRFTQAETLVYAAFAVVALFAAAQTASPVLVRRSTWLIRIGSWSYLIYLFHTLVLRLIFRFPW